MRWFRFFSTSDDGQYDPVPLQEVYVDADAPELPFEIWCAIMRYLNDKSLSMMRQVNRAFRNEILTRTNILQQLVLYQELQRLRDAFRPQLSKQRSNKFLLRAMIGTLTLTTTAVALTAIRWMTLKPTHDEIDSCIASAGFNTYHTGTHAAFTQCLSEHGKDTFLACCHSDDLITGHPLNHAAVMEKINFIKKCFLISTTLAGCGALITRRAIQDWRRTKAQLADYYEQREAILDIIQQLKQQPFALNLIADDEAAVDEVHDVQLVLQ